MVDERVQLLRELMQEPFGPDLEKEFRLFRLDQALEAAAFAREQETENYAKPDYRMPKASGGNHFTCDLIGISGTTPVWVKRTKTGREDWPYRYEFRVGIAIFGSGNDPDVENKTPFDLEYDPDTNPDGWFDNYSSSKAAIALKALHLLEEELGSLSEGLWAEPI